MRFSEFKRILKQKNRCEEQIKLFLPLDELYVYPSSSNKSIKLVDDHRSVEFNGRWKVKPIAISDSAVFIVCPYCHEVHSHGNAGGSYDGIRVPHCNDSRIVKNYEILEIVKKGAKHEKRNNRRNDQNVR